MYGRTAQGSAVEAAGPSDVTVDGPGRAATPGGGLGLGPGAACAGWALAPSSVSSTAPRTAVERVEDFKVLPPEGVECQEATRSWMLTVAAPRAHCSKGSGRIDNGHSAAAPKA